MCRDNSYIVRCEVCGLQGWKFVFQVGFVSVLVRVILGCRGGLVFSMEWTFWRCILGILYVETLGFGRILSWGRDLGHWGALVRVGWFLEVERWEKDWFGRCWNWEFVFCGGYLM